MLARASTAASPGILGFLRAVLPYVRPHAAQAVAAVVSTFPQALFIGAYPLLLRTLIDDGILPRNVGLSAAVIGALVGLLALNAVGDLVYQYLFARVAALVLSDMRVRIFEHLQRLSMGFYSRSQVGDLMARFTTNLDTVERAIAIELPRAVAQGLVVVLGTLLLFGLEWRLGLLCLLLFPILLILPGALGSRASRATHRRQVDAARLASTVYENVTAQHLVKTLGLDTLFGRRVRAESAELVASSIRASFLGSVLGTSMNATGYVLLVGVIGAGTYLTFQNELSVGALVAFFELLWWILDGLQQLTALIGPVQLAAGGMFRVQELLGERADVADDSQATTLADLHHEIRFEHVTFSYTGETSNLADVSFSIRHGETVAFVGASGCGKSTVLQLLLRLYDPQSGSITIDDHDVRSATQASLRAQMGVVLQDNLLFNVSIGENIRLGRLTATASEVETAARHAEIHDTIVSLPDGYDTVIGERGSRLSGGQRQRIAIARALVRNPAVLVLDEASAALDAATEATVNATLARVSAGRTVVTVTHRLASARDADRIFVLDRGQVIQHGPHAELVGQDGLYRELWHKQNAVHVDEDALRAWIEPARLRAIPVLSGLDDEFLAVLADRFVVSSIAAGRTVMHEGDPGDSFCILVRGSVVATRQGPSGEERLRVMQDGDYFGEIALLRSVPRSASVTTLTPCILLTLGRGQFLQLVDRAPDVARELAEVAAARHPESGDARTLTT